MFRPSSIKEYNIVDDDPDKKDDDEPDDIIVKITDAFIVHQEAGQNPV